jgi:hypothetical protein
MNNVALENRINRDMFRNSDITMDELCRRLTLLTEQLYQCLVQIQGNQLVNLNIQYHGDLEAPDLTDGQNETVKSTTVYSFNLTGETVTLRFDKGRIQK